jgi:nicotinamidase/pyrazinamidase
MKKALIIVDVQNDFCEGGALAVPGANEVIPYINALMEENEYDQIVPRTGILQIIKVLPAIMAER